MMKDQTCTRCKKTFSLKSTKDMSQHDKRVLYAEMIAVHDYKMCKDCILGSGEFNQRKAASIIRKINRGGKYS